MDLEQSNQDNQARHNIQNTFYIDHETRIEQRATRNSLSWLFLGL